MCPLPCRHTLDDSRRQEPVCDSLLQLDLSISRYPKPLAPPSTTLSERQHPVAWSSRCTSGASNSPSGTSPLATLLAPLSALLFPSSPVCRLGPCCRIPSLPSYPLLWYCLFHAEKNVNRVRACHLLAVEKRIKVPYHSPPLPTARSLALEDIPLVAILRGHYMR